MAGTRPRVELRAPTGADTEVFYRQQLDPEAVARARFPARDRETFTSHWERQVVGNKDGLVRTVLADGEVSGNIVCWQDRVRMVGYWFGRQYWGRGIATAALGMFLPLAPWRPLYADPHVGNTASVRLLERCGFTRDDVPADDVPADDGHVMLRLD